MLLLLAGFGFGFVVLLMWVCCADLMVACGFVDWWFPLLGSLAWVDGCLFLCGLLLFVFFGLGLVLVCCDWFGLRTDVSGLWFYCFG